MVFAASGPAQAVENKKGDRCLTVLFPNGPGVKFDIDYYVNHHIPLIFSLYGKSIRNYEVFQAQASPNGPPPQFLAMANIWIADEKAFAQAGRDHAKDFAPGRAEFHECQDHVDDQRGLQGDRQPEQGRSAEAETRTGPCP